MDPDAALARIREDIKHLAEESMLSSDCADLASDTLADVADLDEWLSNGGFKPKAWDDWWNR